MDTLVYLCKQGNPDLIEGKVSQITNAKTLYLDTSQGASEPQIVTADWIDLYEGEYCVLACHKSVFSQKEVFKMSTASKKRAADSQLGIPTIQSMNFSGQAAQVKSSKAKDSIFRELSKCLCCCG